MTPTEPAARAGHRGWVVPVMRTARPHHWIKNLLVLAAPVLSGQLFEAKVLIATFVAFVAFCLASSGVYYVNDARDVELDAQHPVKRLRPVAAGQLGIPTAYGIGFSMILGAIGLSVLAEPGLVGIVAVYAGVQLAYCFWLKDEVLIDIAAIAAGFLLRALAGGIASDIELSEWFILAASFGSLYMAAGKRYSEMTDAEIPVGSTRRSLQRYTATYVRFVWTLSAGVLIMTYGLWAFDERALLNSVLPIASMAPFVLAVLRYALHVDAGDAAQPEDIALKDRWLQGLTLIWLILVAWPVFHPS